VTTDDLEDLSFVDVVTSGRGPLFGGLGVASIFPLATSPQLGAGKLQLGPAAAGRWDVCPALRLATLVQALWSIAGSSSSPDLGYLTVQPFVTVFLPAALFLTSNATMTFFWAGGSTTVPVNLGFGHAFSPRFVASVKGQTTVAGAAFGNRVELDLNFNLDRGDSAPH